MKKILWATDIHLDFTVYNNPEIYQDRKRFYKEINGSGADCLLIGGDISTSQDLLEYLFEMDKKIRLPVYFVLGNHDYYGGYIADVNKSIQSNKNNFKKIIWLDESGIVELNEKTCLIGHTGWYDALNAPEHFFSNLINDYSVIKDYSLLKSKNEILFFIRQLTMQSSEYIRIHLENACKKYKNVILLTHVPPFKAAAYYEGQISSDEYLLHFSNKIIGDMLIEIMGKFSQNNLTVLCGHTHSRVECRIRENIIVFAGEAHYGSPKINMRIDI